jgi:hypothetical protein
MEGKKLVILAAGIIVVTLVVLAGAFFVLSNNEPPAATPTPAPETTPAPTAGTSAANPTAKPAESASPTPQPGGPIIMQTNFNGTMNTCFVSIFLNTDTSPIDVTSLKMDVEADGRTYHNVWTIQPSDWAGSNGNSLLEPKEALTTQINTKTLGIAQGRPITIRILQDSAVLKETTVSPT